MIIRTTIVVDTMGRKGKYKRRDVEMRKWKTELTERVEAMIEIRDRKREIIKEMDYLNSSRDKREAWQKWSIVLERIHELQRLEHAMGSPQEVVEELKELERMTRLALSEPSIYPLNPCAREFKYERQ